MRRRKKTTEHHRGLLIALEIFTPIALLALWWAVSAGSTNIFFPPLQEILVRLWQLSQTPDFLIDVGTSLGNLLLSFVLASVIGIAAGLLLGTTRALAWLLEPAMHFFRAIPPVALVPIFVSLIGFENSTRILSITIAALFPVLISTMDGVRSNDPTLDMVGRVYRLTWSERLFLVTLPAAAPRIVSGMQVSLIAAFVVMIASEMLGSSTGLGAKTLLAQQTFAIADMWAGILLLGVLGYLVNAVFDLFRRRVLRWYIAAQQQERQL
ncbi:ABC transporter permease [Brevibacterium luteolum]|nr:ABC transporter permease [Brevibacterium luteolum]